MRFKYGSGFSVRVASQDGGSARGQTARIVHLTEAAFFARWNDQLDALSAIVPDLPGTILLAETTADFMGSEYHAFFQRALAGTAGDWEAWFAPWFLMDEYATEPPADFTPAVDDRELMEMYKLTPAQIYWRRRTLAGYSDPKRFQREMPASAVEAYQSAEVQEGFFSADDIMRARKASSKAHGPLVLGVDVSYVGKDRSVIAHRRSREITKIESFNVGGMELCGILGKIIDKEKPERVFLDATGGGQIVVDRMIELGYHEREAVTFSGSGHVLGQEYGSAHDWRRRSRTSQLPQPARARNLASRASFFASLSIAACASLKRCSTGNTRRAFSSSTRPCVSISARAEARMSAA